MTDEEKNAIEDLKEVIELYNDKCLITTEDDIKSIKILLNLIEKQSKEIEHQKLKRENQRNELAILNAKQIEFNKLVNTVNSYKGQFKKQQKEIEELKEDLKKKPMFLIKDIYSPKIKEINLQDIEGLIEQGREEVKDKIKAKIEDILNSENSEAIEKLIEWQSLLEKE